MLKSFIAKITGSEVAKNKDASLLTRLFSSEASSQDDTRTLEQMTQAGIEVNPPDESKSLAIQLSQTWFVSVATQDKITPSIDKGEVQLYSQVGDAKKSIIWLKKDGSIDITAGSDLNLDGNLNVDGDLDVTGAISAAGNITSESDISADGDISAGGGIDAIDDIVADSGGTAISLLNHTHLGNMGFDTVSPTPGAPVAAPASLPSTNASGDIIGGDGINLSIHTHTQPNDSNGDAEQPTSVPV